MQIRAGVISSASCLYRNNAWVTLALHAFRSSTAVGPSVALTLLIQDH